MPAVPLPYPVGLDRYKWFARFLLEGQVVPMFKQFIPTLLSTPSTMVKSWARSGYNVNSPVELRVLYLIPLAPCYHDDFQRTLFKWEMQLSRNGVLMSLQGFLSS